MLPQIPAKDDELCANIELSKELVCTVSFGDCGADARKGTIRSGEVAREGSGDAASAELA